MSSCFPRLAGSRQGMQRCRRIMSRCATSLAPRHWRTCHWEPSMMYLPPGLSQMATCRWGNEEWVHNDFWNENACSRIAQCLHLEQGCLDGLCTWSLQVLLVQLPAGPDDLFVGRIPHMTLSHSEAVAAKAAGEPSPDALHPGAHGQACTLNTGAWHPLLISCCCHCR